MKPLQFQIVEELVGEDAPALAIGNDYIISDGMGGTGGAEVTFANDKETLQAFIRVLLADLTPLREEPKRPAAKVVSVEEDEPDEEIKAEEPINEEAKAEEPATEEALEEPVSLAEEEPEEEIVEEPAPEPIPFEDDPELAAYFERIVSEIFHPGSEQKEVSRTSAYIGSRIVALRYAFALRHDLTTRLRFAERPTDFFSPKKIDEIRDFIIAGLKQLIDCPVFNIPAPTNALQAYLPATLASVSVRQEEDGKYFLDVLWAGDSRVYAYSRTGLYQLSKDDEDETGMMNNFFTYNPAKKTRLNHRPFRFPGPVMVFACSDGCFDPFSFTEAMGVARTFFGEEKKIPASMDDWAKEIIGRYLSEGLQGDDISIALGLYGFKDIAEVFELYFIKHAATNNHLYHLAKQYATELDILSKGEMPEKDQYFSTRLPAIYRARLVPFLLDCFHGVKSDFIYTPELDQLIHDGVPKTRPYTAAETRKIQLEALKIAALRDDPHFAIKKSEEAEPLIDAFKQMKEVAEDIRHGRASVKDFLASYDAFCEELERLDDLCLAFKGGLLKDLDQSEGFVVIPPEELELMYEPFLVNNADKIIPLIVKALEEHPEENSLIDGFFNPGLAAKCRMNLIIRQGKLPQEVYDLPAKIKVQEDHALSLLNK